MSEPAAPPEPLLWSARPNMPLLWAMAAVTLAASLPALWHLIQRLFLCASPCGLVEVNPVFVAIALFLAPIAAVVAALVPLGGLRLDYRLTERRFTLRHRLLGREKITDLAMPGHRFSVGRGWTILIHPSEPGVGSRAFLICLRRRDIDSLREALPEGAWG